MVNLNDGLVLYLPMKEGTGNRVWDRSKHQNHGTIYGATWVEPFNDPSRGSWLKGWSKRIKVTVDSSKVDEDLTDFPVLLLLLSSAGIGGADVTCVFDEVGSNYQKIAVTTMEGTQCYVEVVSWDATGETAELWVKVPRISCTRDTVLYLYYDGSHADNSSYVGLTGTAPAQNVWSNGYVGVWHMNDATTTTIADSTSYGNDGTKLAENEPQETDGQIGKAQNFDGMDDYVDIFDSSSLSLSTAATLIFYMKANADLNMGLLVKGDSYNVQAAMPQSGIWCNFLSSGESYPTRCTEPQISTGEWHHIVITLATPGAPTIYIDGSPATAYAYRNTVPGSIDDSDYSLKIGYIYAGTNYYNGILDEAYVLNRAMSPAEVSACYSTQTDSLLTYGSEESYSKLACNWRFGDALSFDGTDDYVSITETSSSVGVDDALTISIWIKPLDQIAGQYNYHKDIIRSSSGGGKWGISTDSNYNTNEVLRILIGWITGTDSWWYPNNGIANKNEWNHLVVVMDRTVGKAKFYNNGRFIDEATVTVGTKPVTANFAIAYGYAGAFKGVIDEVRVYNRALSPEEIRLLYKLREHT